MSVRSFISMSLDRFVAGPNQTLDEPLGTDGERLHDWAFPTDAWRADHGLEGGVTNASSAAIEEQKGGVGAVIMGRKMFGGGPGEWEVDPPWEGWWGPEPPYHCPVFVLTHHPRDPLELGETTFNFATGGAPDALAQAKQAAGDQDVLVAGGAEALRQYLVSGDVDTLHLNLVPILLGSGESLFDGLRAEGVRLRLERAVDAPGVTHLTYSPSLG